MEKISWTDRVEHEGVLRRVQEDKSLEDGTILHTTNRRMGKWTGHILRRNCLLKHVIEGKIEGRIGVTGRRGKRRKQLLDDLNEKREYLKLKEEALDRTLWRTRFGGGHRPVVTHKTMNDSCRKSKQGSSVI